jgi:hypothetical protein
MLYRNGFAAAGSAGVAPEVAFDAHPASGAFIHTRWHVAGRGQEPPPKAAVDFPGKQPLHGRDAA